MNLFEFLEKLELVMIKINEYKVKSLCYLAAAVSDFYIPEKDMPDHKI